jgi:predicted small metal-binding protein
MEKVIHCRDLGYDCDGMIRARNEKEAIEMAILHAERAHGLEKVTPEVIMHFKAAVQEKPMPKPVLL